MRPLLIALLLCITPPAFAGGTETAVFSITAAGIPFGDMSLTYTETGNFYAFTVAAQARGLLGFLTQSRYQGQSNGTITAQSTRQPDNFHARSQRIFKDRITTIRFENGIPVSVDLTPLKDQSPLTDPDHVKDKRLDSLTYLSLIFHNPDRSCPPDGKLYDGRRLTEIAFMAQPQTDDLLRCTGTYTITDGPDHSIVSGRRSFGLSLVYQSSDTRLLLQSAVFTAGTSTLNLSRKAP